MIRWITDQIATAARDQLTDLWDVRVIDVRDLLDRQGNTPEAVRVKIDSAVQALRDGERVVICCDYGMSRSNAVAAGVLATHEGLGLNEAVRRVVERTGKTPIQIEVLSAVRRVIEGGAKTDAQEREATHRLLITGASGFIGSSLRNRLSSANFVMAPPRDTIDLVHDTVMLDLMIKEERINTIVHLSNPRISTSHDAMGTCLTMLKNILDLSVENGSYLLYASCWDVYSGHCRAGDPIADDLVRKPRGTHGLTKHLCETLIEHYHRDHNLACLVVRPSMVYGPAYGRPRFLSTFLEKALRNEDIVTHRFENGCPRVDLLHIDDLARALTASVERKVTGTVNLGTGVGTSTTDLALLLVDLTGSHSQIRQQEVEGNTSNIVFDPEPAARALGWRSTIALRAGLQSLVETAKIDGAPPLRRGQAG